MLFKQVPSLGYIPWLMAGSVLVGLATMQAITFAQLTAVTPAVKVTGATRSEVVGPLIVSEEYLKGVTVDLLTSHMNWTADDYVSTIRRTSIFVDEPIKQHFLGQWLRHARTIRATGEGQFAIVGDPVIYDFDPSVGGSLIVPVQVEKYIRGFSYRTFQYRVLLTLKVREPIGRYPYAVKIAAMQVENLTQEVSQ